MEMNSSLNGVAGVGGVGSQAGCSNSFGSLLYTLLKNDSASSALKVRDASDLSSSRS